MFAQALVDIGPPDRKVGLQIGQAEARILESPDRLAERLALLDIVLGDIERLLRGSNRVKGDRQPLLRQFAHQRTHRSAFRAQQVAHGNADLVEEQL